MTEIPVSEDIFVEFNEILIDLPQFINELQFALTIGSAAQDGVHLIESTRRIFLTSRDTSER